MDAKWIAAWLCLFCLSFQVQAAEEIVPTPARHLATIKTRTPVGSPDRAGLSRRSSYPTSQPVDETFTDYVERQCQTGTLLFSRGDCLAVKMCTGSRYTHVGAVVIESGIVWVYDSMNGAGVRKSRMQKYLSEQRDNEVTLFHPHRKLTVSEATEFQAALEAELGRDYSVAHFLTGKRGKGLHCAEYLTDALIEIDWLRADNPARVSPASLLNGICLSEIYDPGEVVLAPQSLQPIPEVDGWCEEIWQTTRRCMNGSCQQLTHWFLCR